MDLGSGSWTHHHRPVTRHGADRRALRAVPEGAVEPGAFFAETAARLRDLLGEVQEGSISALTVGATWSFGDLLADAGVILEMRPSSAVFAVEPDQVVDADSEAARMVLASGGTSIRQLNRFLESNGLSLITSGAHDEQTIAGAMATGAHGSVVGFGSFGNQVRGVHLVTGPGRSLWIERGPNPILDPDYALRFADAVIHEVDAFEAAVVHLGGLGIVNAVLLEVAPAYRMQVVKRERVIRREWLMDLQEGRFAAFAKRVWPEGDRVPYHVEVILNPFAPYAGFAPLARPALITLYFKDETVPSATPAAADYGPADDVLNLLARGLPAELLPPPFLIPEAVAMMFDAEPRPGEAPRLKSWGQANGAHERPNIGGIDFDLYNAAYALPRKRLTYALDTMLKAFMENSGGHLVFTLRFVSNACGLLAFTRFPETVVINLDGMRTPHSTTAARNVALSLERENIPFSQHWGKMGAITPNRFMRDYGRPDDPLSLAGRWRAARRRLLPTEMLPLLGNEALRNWGLME